MNKIKYAKPMSLDAGQVAAIQGASCSYGNTASDGCIIGDDPNLVPYCLSTGNIATGNCETVGNSAGSACMDGGTPRATRCYAGGTV